MVHVLPNERQQVPQAPTNIPNSLSVFRKPAGQFTEPLRLKTRIVHDYVTALPENLAERPDKRRSWIALIIGKKLEVVERTVFRGSFSIKSVLPALVPDMTYEGMEVADGNEAGLSWERMIRGEVDPTERQLLKAALLAYCRQDTLAMVKILASLRGNLRDSKLRLERPLAGNSAVVTTANRLTFVSR